MIRFLTAMSPDEMSCILCNVVFLNMYVPCVNSFHLVLKSLVFKWRVDETWSLSSVHQMFTIIFFFVVVVCSVDRAQMSGMAFIKALSCPLLQRTGSESSVKALSFSSVVYSWMFVSINLISPHFSFPVIILIITFACFSVSCNTRGGTMKNNDILKTLKSNLLLVQDVI